MKRLGLSIFILISSVGISYCQSGSTSEQTVFDAKEIVFYGYDFTHFRLSDVKRMDQDIKKFVFIWTEFCQEHITEKTLRSWLEKDEVTFNLYPTLTLNKTLNSENLGWVTPYTISKDSIQSYIDEYQITEKQGVGFVVIVECFDNASKRASGYFTFFDIATKQFLMADYVSSRDKNSYNRVIDWGIALELAFKKYSTVYKDKKKIYTE